MATYTPISEAEIWELLNDSWEKMSLQQRRLWDLIRVDPAKWEQEPYGTRGGGFWVVAIYGSQVIWFNDIEGGFNRSSWNVFGQLAEYWCNQDELQWTVQYVLNEFADGYRSGGFAGPPTSIK